MSKKYWFNVYDRGLDTVAVWSCCSSLFPVGELILIQHSADVLAVGNNILQCAQAEQALQTARAGRDGAAAVLREMCVRACRMISGILPPGDLAARKLRAVHAVRGQSFRAVESKITNLIAAWEAVNTYRASLTPAQPALVVGTTDVTALKSLLGNYVQLLAEVANKQPPLTTKKAQLRAATLRVDRNNKRWYKAWQGQFGSNSPEYAALSQIGTGSGQTLPGQGVFLSMELLPNQVVRLNFGAARAVNFTLSHKGPGDSAYTVLASGLTVKTYDHMASSLGAHSYMVTGHNAAGNGAPSTPTSVNVAQEAAA